MKSNRQLFGGMLLAVLMLLVGISDAVGATAMKANERVVFFPTIGWPVTGGEAWECEIHGEYYESDQRRIPLAVLRAALTIQHDKLDEAEKAIFNGRARAFMVDNERRKAISIRVGELVFAVGKSGANGHFSGRIKLDKALVAQVRSGNGLPFTAVLSTNESRVFSGRVTLVEEQGIGVISDIDDTIKVSQVRQKRKLLANTFYKPFAPVPGMAELYQRWEKELHTEVHYVSASPWQLFDALSGFVASNGFPAGAFYLKQFRVKDETFFNLFKSPETYKLSVIEPLLKQFPQKQFILVGDSGEKDPETYGHLARRFPGQIKQIYIRDVTDEAADGDRYAAAFKGVDKGKWQLFREPGEIR